MKRSEEKKATVPLVIENIQSALYSGAKKMRIIERGIQTCAKRSHAWYTSPRIL